MIDLYWLLQTLDKLFMSTNTKIEPLSHDTLWKNVTEDFAFDFVRYFFPELFALIDTTVNPKFLDKDLKQLFADHGNNHKVDRLIEFTLKNGKREYVWIHIEIQEYYDKQFARRMFEYYYKLLELSKDEVEINSIAILADDRQGFKPNEYIIKSSTGTKLQYTFNTFKLLDHEPEALRQDDNPFGFIMETARRYLDSKKDSDAEKFTLQRELRQQLRKLGHPDEQISVLLRFLRDYFIYDESKNYSTFDIESKEEQEFNKPMGMFETIAEVSAAQGRVEGKAEGKAEGIHLSKHIIKALQAGKQPQAVAKEYEVELALVYDLKETFGL